jgi:hypothetical protein
MVTSCTSLEHSLQADSACCMVSIVLHRANVLSSWFADLSSCPLSLPYLPLALQTTHSYSVSLQFDILALPGMGLTTLSALQCMVPGIAKFPAVYLILDYNKDCDAYRSGAARKAMASLGLVKA